MATPEETRERIKEMRERIFERSTEVSVKNDSQETPQKSGSNKNKTKKFREMKKFLPSGKLKTRRRKTRRCKAKGGTSE